MTIFRTVAEIAEIALFAGLAFTAAYLFIFSLAGAFGYRPKPAAGKHLRRFAVLIPGYKEDSVIVNTAREALAHDYPEQLFRVFVIADSFREETLAGLRETGVNIIHVSFEQSSKAKAINRALAEIGEGYDSVAVLDADNIMAPGFLHAANDAFDRGFAAVQGHRTAKNLNTPFAILDAASEEINNHIFRKGHRVLGLSSALIGSGMAFDFVLFRDTMAGVTAHGEDKELEMHLLAAGIRIEYLPEALVYDEKIQSAGVFAKQRKRWLAAQFGMFRQYAPSGLKQLFTKGNLDLFDKVVQVMLPPRVLTIGLTTILLLAAALLHLVPGGSEFTSVSLTLYAALWLVTAAALAIAFPRRLLNGDLLRALKQLPGAFLVMFGLLFRLRGAGKNFIHTPHGSPDPGKS